MKQLILKLDEQTNHSIVLEDLDQFRLLVVEPQVGFLKQQLDILLEENTYAAGTLPVLRGFFGSLTRCRSCRHEGPEKDQRKSSRMMVCLAPPCFTPARVLITAPQRHRLDSPQDTWTAIANRFACTLILMIIYCITYMYNAMVHRHYEKTDDFRGSILRLFVILTILPI